MNAERLAQPKLPEFTHGWSTKVRKLRPNVGVLSDTALHEAKHMVILIVNGTGAKSGTITPGEHYHGMVEPNAPDVEAAVAAYADGHKGAGHDVQLVRYWGSDPDIIAPVVRNKLSKLKEEVRAVANLLEIKRTISGADAEEAIRESRDPEEIVDITEPTGKVVSIQTLRSRRSLIISGVAEKIKQENIVPAKENKILPFVSRMKDRSSLIDSAGTARAVILNRAA